MKLEIFADYYQFYIQDEKANNNLTDAWTEEAVKHLIAIEPGVIGIGTSSNTTVPVEIEILESKPQNENLNLWDLINECSITIKSGKLVIAGCTDYFPEAKRISVNPGEYGARIYYKDIYRIFLWPIKNPLPLTYVK